MTSWSPGERDARREGESKRNLAREGDGEKRRGGGLCWAEKERKQGDRLENEASSSWLQQRPIASRRKVTAASRHPR